MASERTVAAAPTKEMVREQVARISASHSFRSSKRCQQLLDYITEQSIEGQSERLKERLLGVEVFGRDPGYDTAQDPVVRYTAGEVRKRLAQYYQEPGHERELRIQLPLGSYVPEFHLPEIPAAAAVPAGTPLGAGRWVAAAAVAAAATAGLWYAFRPAPTMLDQFWAPVLSDRGPVLLCVGEARVFSFPEPTRSEVRRQAEQYFLAGRPVPQSELPSVGLLPLWDRYVPLGDAVCLARLAGLLEQSGKPYRIRGGRQTSLADLRDGTGVLIGAFTNEWTMRMTEGLRFYLQFDSQQSWGAIWDRSRPKDEAWKVANTWPDPKHWTDFGLVSRLRHPSTGRIIITAAGLNRYATGAAGELLTSAESLRKALKDAPSDWERKNIQMVFSTLVVEGSAGPPNVVALHVW
jgi:hypothetical protein